MPERQLAPLAATQHIDQTAFFRFDGIEQDDENTLYIRGRDLAGNTSFASSVDGASGLDLSTRAISICRTPVNSLASFESSGSAATDARSACDDRYLAFQFHEDLPSPI